MRLIMHPSVDSCSLDATNCRFRRKRRWVFQSSSSTEREWHNHLSIAQNGCVRINPMQKYSCGPIYAASNKVATNFVVSIFSNHSSSIFTALRAKSWWKLMGRIIKTGHNVFMTEPETIFYEIDTTFRFYGLTCVRCTQRSTMFSSKFWDYVELHKVLLVRHGPPAAERGRAPGLRPGAYMVALAMVLPDRPTANRPLRLTRTSAPQA